MEHIMGAIGEGEWSSFSGMYTTDQEADFMAQLLGTCPVSTESSFANSSSSSTTTTFWPGSHGGGANFNSCVGSYFCSSDVNGGGIFYPSSSSSQDTFYLSDSHQILGTNYSNDNINNNPNNHHHHISSVSMDFGMGDTNCNTGSYLIDNHYDQESDDGNKLELGFQVKSLQLKNESVPELQAATEPVAARVEEKLNNNNNNNSNVSNNPSESSKKRSRNASDVQKNNKRNARSKKNQKIVVSAASNKEEEKTITNNNNNNNGDDDTNKRNAAGFSNKLQHPSNSCCSEDESNASQDQIGGEDSSMSSKGKAAADLSGKTRASRGSATDPQSLYARKRRERINERLRILQGLVPNGTKVDISTMLEEAVEYVKFLQLQIKLLSSDDLWMYSPIAYNGMNLGLDHLKVAAASKLSLAKGL